MEKEVVIPVKKGLQRIFILVCLFLYMMSVPVAEAKELVGANDSGGMSEKIEEIKKKLKEDKDKYRVDTFEITYFTTLDSANSYDTDAKKDKDSPVQWYKENGSWVFSAATTYRLTVAKNKLASKYGSRWKERQQYVGNDKEKVVYEMVFEKGVEVSSSDRKSVLPVCLGKGMNYAGSPWDGASGKVPKTGMVAADPKVLKQGAKLFVQGYGFGEVGDTGGAIKGKHIDLVVNNCELALSKGRHSALVAFEKSKASIDGKALTDALINQLVSKGVYSEDNVDVGDDGVEEDPKEGSGDDDQGYKSPFNPGKMQINQIGIDDRSIEDSRIVEYGAYKVGYKIGLWLFHISQGISIFLIGIMSLYWILASMSYMGVLVANELLYKMTFKKVDVLVDGGFGVLAKYTVFAFIVIAIIITGTTPKMFALIYSMLHQMIEYFYWF